MNTHPLQTPGGIFLPGAGRFVRAVPQESYRSIEQGDLTINYGLAISVPITSLVKGKPRARQLLSRGLFRSVSVPWAFQYKIFGLEARMRKDTRREMRAKFEKSDRRYDTASGKLVRHGWAAMLDRDEIGIAEASNSLVGTGLNVQADAAALARDIVELDLEYRASVIALATASYSSSPDLDDTIGAGSEWNAAGDSRANVRSMVARLAAANGVQPDNIKVTLTDASFQAALDDPELNLRLSNGANIGIPTAEQLRSYWGVGSVVVADSYYSTDGTNLVSMYGDVAIFTINNLGGFDTREGELDSFVRFNWQNSPGVAGQPFYDPDRTSWIFPWEAWESAAQVNTTAAGIIRNTAA